MVTRRESLHARADFPERSRTLVAADDRQRCGQVADADVLVGMTQAGGLPRHQHFAVLRRIEIDLLDGPVASEFQRMAAFVLSCPQVRG